MRKHLQGIEGFDAQAAALAPPTDDRSPPAAGPAQQRANPSSAPAGPVAPATPVAPEAPGEVEAEAPTFVDPSKDASAVAELTKAQAAAEQMAQGDARQSAEGGGGRGKKKQKPKDKKKEASGGLKTKGPEEIVATYGTVAEADKRQGSVQVYWVDGLQTVQRKGKEKKTTKEREGIDEIAEPDWQGVADQAKQAKKDKRRKGKKAPAPEAVPGEEQVAKPKTQSIPVHEKLVPTFTEIFEDMRKSGDWRNILERPWAHNARQNRNNPTQWSVHSWGTAIDVNPTTNPNAPGAKDYSPSDRQKSIAQHFTKRGFMWLKDSDAMHFQLHSGGTPKINDVELDGIIADDDRKEADKQYPGTSRDSLIRDVNANIKRKGGERAKVAKLLDKARAKAPPTNAKKLKKHEARIASLEQSLAAIDWWIKQYQTIVDKLVRGSATQVPAEAMSDAPAPGPTPGEPGA